MKGIFINMILDPFEAIQADSFWYIIAFENFKRYFLRLLIHRQLHNFSGRRSWVLTLISMHPDVPMSLRLWVVTLWKPRTDLVVSHSLHLGFSCCLSKTAVCLYCGNLWHCWRETVWLIKDHKWISALKGSDKRPFPNWFIVCTLHYVVEIWTNRSV